MFNSFFIVNLSNASNIESNILSQYILLKYKENIKYIVSTVNIYPKNYKDPLTLNKKWLVQYYPSSGRGVSPVQIKSFDSNGTRISINRIKDHKEKVETIELCRDAVIYLFKNDPRAILRAVYGEDKSKDLYPSVFGFNHTRTVIKIEDAFNECFEFKKNQDLSIAYISDLKSVKNRFLKYHVDYLEDTTDLLSLKMCLDFIKDTTKGTSNRNYNNLKTTLGVYFSYFLDNGYVKENYAQKIKNLKTSKRRNKAFNDTQVTEIFSEVDFKMKFFLMHVYYGLMRPQTISRLKVKDVDIQNKVFKTDTKTGDFIKVITKPLLEVYNTLDLSNPDAYIFGYNGLIEVWRANDITRRNRYTKLFKPVKDKLGYSNDYTIYSFRHSGIGKIFINRCEELKSEGVTDYINESCKFIMPFTNHKSIDQVKEYLRDFVKEIHFDWSDYQ